jgi:hypothetical protein
MRPATLLALALASTPAGKTASSENRTAPRSRLNTLAPVQSFSSTIPEDINQSGVILGRYQLTTNSGGDTRWHGFIVTGVH